MTPNELRETFLKFFEDRTHTRVPSASLAPENDPTLLFTGAGMNQFKDEFLGKGRRGLIRATTAQKCLRTGDLENVGRTSGHHSFFEMLGNFSFGDYFKRESILWAWEFLTEVLKLDKDRLAVTVYMDDDEAFSVWNTEAGIPAERIFRFDAKENYWPADAIEKGPNGPCGPCSEIFFDYGDQGDCADPANCDPSCDCSHYIEIWNLVFTQYERREGGELVPLPQKNIDTGAGFERLVSVTEGKVFTLHSSLFRPLLDGVARLTGREQYEESGEDGVRMRRISDHVRAACFLVGDGVRPSNEGRGYVLRRILRRAIRDGHGLGITEPFLTALVEPVVDAMGGGYPDLQIGSKLLEGVLNAEEMQFRKTFRKGMGRLEGQIEEARAAGATEMGADMVFQLHDTFGFPVDVTAEILAEEGLSFSRAGYDTLMEEQRRKSKGAQKMVDDIFHRGPLGALAEQGVGETDFLGYGDRSSDDLNTRHGVAADVLLVGALTEGGAGLADELADGDAGVLVLDRTPFYAESGGQMGDTGVVRFEHGTFNVDDCCAKEGYWLHHGRFSGTAPLQSGSRGVAEVDITRRDAIRRNHTATHLFHKALKNAVGDQVQQAGSLVAPDRLRFDFTLDRGLTSDEIRTIEDEVNAEIVGNAPLETLLMSVEEAKASGAVALFGEKYPDPVRVVAVGEYSKELCGGTHCHAAGDIGSFRVTSESSIAAGIRRIEAVTGLHALEWMQRERGTLAQLSRTLGVATGEIGKRVDKILKDMKTLRKQAKSTSGPAFDPITGDALSGATFSMYVHVLDLPRADVAAAGQALANRPGDPVAALMVTVHEGKIAAVCAGNPAAVAAGFVAAKVLQGAGGRGGGKPPMAQGTFPAAPELAELRAAVEATL